MDEILQKLLSSELLSEEAKVEISAKWNETVEQYKETVKEQVTIDVRNQLAEQWANERDVLIENVEQFVSKKLEEEVAELREDIERFRDLEAEYAEKIVEEKHAMASTLAEELDELTDKIDAFFELRLTEEMSELKEDIEFVKQNEFGRKIFEAFSSEFNNSYVDEDSIQSKLSATKAKLRDAQKEISRLEESQSKMLREAKLKEVLSSLSGKKREQMEFVLQNVETSRLEEAYKHFIGRVLKEDDQEMLKENKKSTVVRTGNQLDEEQKAPVDKYAHLKRLAGI